MFLKIFPWTYFKILGINRLIWNFDLYFIFLNCNDVDLTSFAHFIISDRKINVCHVNFNTLLLCLINELFLLFLSKRRTIFIVIWLASVAVPIGELGAHGIVLIISKNDVCRHLSSVLIVSGLNNHIEVIVIGLSEVSYSR